ncbi:MAG: helix-turn-helix transcriptional regulator [Rickettsiaceae bacterium]|nr:helix-turn-helix transcriptional regulator [Rickettsiaceae bacterium]
MQENSDKKGKVDFIDNHVGKRLKMRRIMLGLSQQDLGDAVNVSIQQIQKYEKATNRISSGKLYSLAKLLMVPVEFFFKDLETKGQKNGDFAFADQKDGYSSDDIGDKDLATLIKYYVDIKDLSVRKKIIDLVKAISSNATNGG